MNQVYVNHRAVPNDDETATHLKASKGFLSEWMNKGLKVITLEGSTDAPAEAKAYAEKITAIPEDQLPRDKSGLPIFDQMLIGVGLDGHVGSLYPDKPEVLEEKELVLPVVKPSSSSITLTLPLIKASKEVVVASAGKSEKYPEGKAVAMKRALQGSETPSSFPASALAEGATWLLDEGAAAQLKL